MTATDDLEQALRVMLRQRATDIPDRTRADRARADRTRPDDAGAGRFRADHAGRQPTGPEPVAADRALPPVLPIGAGDRASVHGRPSRRHRRTVAAVTLAAAVAVAGLILIGRDRQVTVEAADGPVGPWPVAPPSAAELPPGALDTGLVVLGPDDPLASDDPFSTATGYLTARLPDIGIRTDEARSAVGDTHAVVRWGWNVDSADEHTAAGWVYLRRDDDAGPWSIVAATTDGIDASAVTRADRSIELTVRSTNIDFLAVDIVEPPLGRPIDPTTGVPLTVGRYEVGTAAERESGLDGTALDTTIDSVIDEPVGIRIHEVGGTMLSVTEFVLEPT